MSYPAPPFPAIAAPCSSLPHGQLASSLEKTIDAQDQGNTTDRGSPARPQRVVRAYLNGRVESGEPTPMGGSGGFPIAGVDQPVANGVGDHLGPVLQVQLVEDVAQVLLVQPRRERPPRRPRRWVVERTFATVVGAIGQGLETISAADCRGFFTHCWLSAALTEIRNAAADTWPAEGAIGVT